MKLAPVNKPAARQRFDAFCKITNAGIPPIVVSRTVTRPDGSSFVQNYERPVKLICDGAQNTGKILIHALATSIRETGNLMPDGWHDDSEGFSLKTNNVKLANFRQNISDRTIRRHLIQLKTSGFVKNYRFHGTKSDFEIWLDPKIIYGELEKPLDLDRLSILARESDTVSLTEPPSFSPPNDTNCPLNQTIETMETEIIANQKVEKCITRRLGNGNTGLAEEKLPKRQDSNSSLVENGNEVGGGGGGRSVDNPSVMWISQEKPWYAPVVAGLYSKLPRSYQHFVAEFWSIARKTLFADQTFSYYQGLAALDSITAGVYRKIFITNPDLETMTRFHQDKLEALKIAVRYYDNNEKKYPGLPFAQYNPGMGFFDADNQKGFNIAQGIQSRSKYHKDKLKDKQLVYIAIRHLRNHPEGKAPKNLQKKTYKELFNYYFTKIRRCDQDIQLEFAEKLKTLNVFSKKSFTW